MPHPLRAGPGLHTPPPAGCPRALVLDRRGGRHGGRAAAAGRACSSSGWRSGVDVDEAAAAAKRAAEAADSSAPSSFVSLDVPDLSSREAFALLCGAIVPRPIGLISTIASEAEGGFRNLAPVSFFMPVTSRPPSLAFTLTRKRCGAKKDSLRNIEATGQFVVNHVTREIFDRAYAAGSEFAADVDEFTAVGLTPLPSEVVLPSRVAESRVHLECEVLQLVPVGGEEHGAGTIVVGRVLRAHIDARIKDPELLVPAGHPALRTVSRLGGMCYGDAQVALDMADDAVWSTKHW